MGLNDALNARKTNQEAAVPVAVPDDNIMILATAPDPTTPTPTVDKSPGGLPLRDLHPGEVGTKSEPAYPDVPYDVDALRTLVQRVRKGCDFMLDNLEGPQGHAQIGYFLDLMEATSCMFVAHMSQNILTNP